MGRKKKIPPAPKNFGYFLKETTDWNMVIRKLKELAMGGYETMNYNGQKIIAQPNMEAMKLLLMFGWGRPTEVNTDNKDEVIEVGRKLADMLKSDMKNRTQESGKGNDNGNK